MKKLFLVLLPVIVLSCGVSSKTQDEDAVTAEKIEKVLKSGNFDIDIRTIYPQTGPAIFDDGYVFSCKDGKVTTVLPFYGTSNVAVFGSASSSIELNGEPVEFTRKAKSPKGSRTLSFSATMSSGVRWDIDIIFWDNGSADFTCISSSQSPMRYGGILRLD